VKKLEKLENMNKYAVKNKVENKKKMMWPKQYYCLGS